jgi:hypothetical protein
MHEPLPPEFYDSVDQFVALANELVPGHGLARVSAIIMFAAARFNAHCARELDPEIDANIDGATTYFTDQYSKMLRDNLTRLRGH